MSTEGTVPTPEGKITARELSRVIRRIAHLFGAGDLGNVRTSDALANLADYLDKMGLVYIDDLPRAKIPISRVKKKAGESQFEALSLDDVKRIIEKGATKVELSNLAQQRFGISRGRLMRLSYDAVVEEIQSALGHEQSLDVIQRNAEISGRNRQS